MSESKQTKWDELLNSYIEAHLKLEDCIKELKDIAFAENNMRFYSELTDELRNLKEYKCL